MEVYQIPFPDETPLAFSYFTAYRDMGPTRSLRALETVEIQGKKRGLRQIGRWSSAFAWQVRVEAFDADVIETAETQAVEKRIKEVQDFIDTDILIVSAIQKDFRAWIESDSEKDPGAYLKWTKIYEMTQKWIVNHKQADTQPEITHTQPEITQFWEELLHLLKLNKSTPEITGKTEIATIGTQNDEETTS